MIWQCGSYYHKELGGTIEGTYAGKREVYAVFETDGFGVCLC